LASRHRWKLAGRWTARPGEPQALNNDRALSRLRRPEWLDEGIGQKVEEQEEIAAGFE
jgi:hypothetical protein